MPQPDERQIGELADFALALARRAGEVILPLFRTSLDARDKAGAGKRFDPVTTADRAAEEAMREMIARTYSDHGVIGEELPDSQGTGDFTWMLDPIDGTRAFLYGLPTWSTLVALLYKGKPFLGVMSQPFVGESFIGSPLGAWRIANARRERLNTRRTAKLDRALAGVTLPEIFTSPRQRHALSAMGEATREMRFDADAYFYAMLAAGQIDIVMDTALKPFDIAALIPIIRAAGGVITDWSGRPDPLGGDILASATPALHAQALARIGGDSSP